MEHRIEEPADLLRRAADGDMEAFGAFYDRHARAVLGWFQARTAAPETAADLTAETFAEALRSIQSYRPDRGSGGAWLFGIARHMLGRYLRRRRVDQRARERLGMATDVVLDDTSLRRIEELVDFAPIRDDVRAAYAGLSPRLAAAVKLRVVDELPFQEVAARLGCSEQAARTRVSRGLRRLSRALEDHR